MGSDHSHAPDPTLHAAHASSRRCFPAPADLLWRIINDHPAHAEWFPAMRSVTPLPPTPARHAAWRHEFIWTALHITVRLDHPHPLGLIYSPIHWNIRDERNHFEAHWCFTFETDADTCLVTLTEALTIHSLLARFWTRLLLPKGHYINKYLDALNDEVIRCKDSPTTDHPNHARVPTNDAGVAS